ncbi:MAG: hypothetical protein KJ051_09805 [Thermoleophilia bacterium]|nr:hypothetical protein [Thermoleophilia bacterium]
MTPEPTPSRFRSFLLGGIIGGVAGLAAGTARARKREPRELPPPGLAAFEDAPCFRETLREEARSQA